MSEKEILERINDLIETCDVGIAGSNEYSDVFYKDKEALVGLVKMYKDLKEIEEAHRKENGKLQEKIKELDLDLTSVYLDGIYDERAKWIKKEENIKKEINYDK